ncbi:MAG: DUF3872 domain-containing protein [Alistipes sp.]|nr:DUF3872 domain-containing protein [Alistipes sp.]
MKYLLILITITLVVMIACEDKLNVRNDYDFTLSSWYMQKDITPGEPVEIRLYLDREGDFEHAKYYIGYIQLDGSGIVHDKSGKRLIDREKIDLEQIAELDKSDPSKWVFTLFYDDAGFKSSVGLRFFVGDYSGKESNLEVEFNAIKPEETE